MTGHGRARRTSLPGPVWLASRRLAPNERYNAALLLAIRAGQILPPGDTAYAFEMELRAAPDARPPQGAEQLVRRCGCPSPSWRS